MNLITIEELRQDQNSIKKENPDNYKLISESGIKMIKIKNKKKILISSTLAKQLIKICHINYGHINKNQIRNMLGKYYYITKLDQKIENLISECKICIENKTRKGAKLGLFSQLGPAKKPLEIVSLDTIGGFVGNNSTKKYLHLLVDHFTRFAFIVTSTTQKPKDFIQLVNKVVSFGRIGAILADQYSGINSEEFKKLLRKLDTKLTFTAVNCPFSNGLNERLNQTLVNRIRCKQNSEPNRPWSMLAEEAVEEYNNTVHSSTGFSPAYLLLGKEPELIPRELRKASNLQADREIAFRNSQRSRDKNFRRINKNRKHYDFKVGDLN